MNNEQVVRRAVARHLWPRNPHSVAMAGAAVRLARLLDAGSRNQMVGYDMRLCLSHLGGCQRDPTSKLDEIRARVCLKKAASHEEYERSQR